MLPGKYERGNFRVSTPSVFELDYEERKNKNPVLDPAIRYPRGVPRYNRGELYEFLFGDSYSKRQEEAQGFLKYQKARLRDLKKSLMPKPRKEGLHIVFNFLVNYKESENISVKVSLIFHEQILLSTQGEVCIRQEELRGVTDQKNAEIVKFKEQIVFQIDFSTLKQNVQKSLEEKHQKELLISDIPVILFQFHKECQVIGWYFHPIVMQAPATRQLQVDVGKFIANIFYPPLQKPPFTQFTRQSYIILGYSIMEESDQQDELRVFNLSKKI